MIRIWFFCLAWMPLTMALADTVSLAPLHRIQNTCLSHDFAKVTCEATPAYDEAYQNAATFENRLQHVASRVFLRTLVWDLPPRGGHQLVNEIHGRLREYAEDNRLDSCQRTALATCAVNQILEYDPSLDRPENFTERMLLGLLPPNYFYYHANSKGICTEFCAVFAQVARAVGLRVQELRNSFHCFNRVRSDGGDWLYVEPQEGGRDPYYLNSNKFYLLKLPQ